MNVQYEKLVADYVEGLTTQLRKFAPAEEFLDLWVHDENHTASVLNMIEAAYSYGLDSLSIDISSEPVRKTIDVDQLKKALHPWAYANFHQKKGGKFLIEVLFNRQTELASLGINDVPSLYRPSFNDTVPAVNFEGSLSENSSFVFSRASHGGVTLQANVDSKTDIIGEVSFSGPTTPVSKKLLCELCHLMSQKPVNECHDHAVISLEYFLRDKSQKRTPPGIVTPFNTWAVFKELTVLVRKLVNRYREQAGRHDQKNFYSPPISPRWLATPDTEKINILTAAIECFCKNQKTNPAWFVIKAIQNHFKVIVDLHPEICKHESTTLLNLETCLREQVEQTLCVYTEEEPDQNKMRWDRPAVKSQIAVPKIVNE